MTNKAGMGDRIKTDVNDVNRHKSVKLYNRKIYSLMFECLTWFTHFNVDIDL